MALLTKQIVLKRPRLTRASKVPTKVKIRIKVDISSAGPPLVVHKKILPKTKYGLDVYGFAKSKPVLLMNDENLLYLLGKYGIKARSAVYGTAK